MTDFHFGSPAYLFALPALVALFYGVRFFDRRVRNRLSAFLHEANLRSLLKDRGTVRERSRKWAFWLGLTMLVLALARPQANPTVEELQSSGLDIYVLLDVSRSMDSEDVAPSRLKKAKRTIQHLASRLSGDRLGIIAFANSAVLVSPLTNDFSIVDTYLKNIDTGTVPSQGTNFGAALETAKDAMERGAKATGAAAAHSNIFLLLSDGEDHAETDLSVVDAIRKDGGLVFSIAVGTDRGAPIPIRDDKGELRGYKKDAAGEVVVTKVETKVLEEIAKRGGGQFYHSTNDEGEVEDLLARVNDAQRGSFTTIKTTIWEEYFWLFLAPGLLLLLVSYVPLGALRFAKIRHLLPRRTAAAALLLAVLAPDRAQAGPISFFWDKDRKASEQSSTLAKDQKFSEAAEALKNLQAENPDSPEVNYDIGTYLLQDKKGRLGREQLSHLRNADGTLRDLALFNVAGSYAMEGNKDEARAAYAELLAHLQTKSKLSDFESQLLAQAKRNVARLSDPAQQPQPQPDQSPKKDQSQGGQQGKDGQDQKDQKDQKDSKDQTGQNKGQGDQKDDKKKDPSKGNDGEKKEDDKSKDGQDKDKDKDKDQQAGQKPEQQQQPNQGQLPPRHGGQPFKDRDNMGEEEAKRILGALKERESDLQKKLLKNQVKGGRVNADDAAKDW